MRSSSFFLPRKMVVICSALNRATAEDRTWSCGHVCFTVKSQKACTYVQALEFFGSPDMSKVRTGRCRLLLRDDSIISVSVASVGFNHNEQ